MFLALDAPHAPVSQAAVTSVAGRALRDAGISGDGAAHLLRHTAACGVLTAGGGLSLLDHWYAAWRDGVRRLDAAGLAAPCGPAEGPYAGPEVTAVYARSDITALRSIARPWPEGEPR